MLEATSVSLNFQTCTLPVFDSAQYGVVHLEGNDHVYVEESKYSINPPCCHRPKTHLVYQLPRPYNAAVYLDRLQDHILSSRKLS
jgi:hypothetical protein